MILKNKIINKFDPKLDFSENILYFILILQFNHKL